MQQKKKKNSQERRNIYLRLGMGLAIGLCMVMLYILRPPLLLQADRHVYDVFLNRSAAQAKAEGLQPSPTPAVIDLDEDSLRRFGQWPWPRHLIAQLLKILTEGGAAAIGLDILLSEEDNTSPLQLQKGLQKFFGIAVGFSGLPASLEDNDLLLAEVMRQTPTICGVFLHFNKDTAKALPEGAGQVLGVVDQTPPGCPPPRERLLRAHGGTPPIAVLRPVAPLGSINVAPDPDGIVRAVPLVVQVDNEIHANLGLRALMRGMGLRTLILQSGPDGLQALRIGKFTVPVTPEGLMHVPFRGPRKTYPYFSAADILEGKIPSSEIQGRVFIVGTSAPGLLDIRAQPLDPVYPGVEVHTTVIDAILSQRSIQVPPWIPGAQVLGIGIICVLGTAAFALSTPVIYLPLTLGLSVGTVWASWRIFEAGIFFSPQYMLLTIIALATALLAVRFWQENRQRRVLRQAFSRYVAPDLVDRISDRGGDILAGEEREVTLMFTDIRSFTSISEKLAPEQVVGMLNRYFTPMTAIIRSSSGTVDKFIGDAIMAFWNAPLDVQHHELRAVRSAMAMHTALAALNEDLEQEMGIRLAMGAGVHTGRVYVGNMGSAELLDYTCIGDTVNLASRLEGMCPVYGVGIVVSGDCAMRCHTANPQGAIFFDISPSGELRNIYAHLHGKDMPVPAPPPTSAQKKLPPATDTDTAQDTVMVFVPLDSIRVKGKHLPVEIYMPLTLDETESRLDELTAFMESRRLYAMGAFGAAADAFDVLRTDTGRPLYALYAERCMMLRDAPPEDWDGVWTYSKK